MRQVGIKQCLGKGTTDTQAGAAETLAFKQPLKTYTEKGDRRCLWDTQAEPVCHLLSVLNHSLSMAN